jgi:hypothetical protein
MATEGAFVLGSWGTLRGRASGVWTTTQIELDAAGSNPSGTTRGGESGPCAS